MKHTYRVVPALAALLGFAVVLPASAAPVSPQAVPGAPRRPRRPRTAPAEMTPAPSQAMAQSDTASAATFSAFYTNLDKANDTLNRMTTLLNQIIAHGGQNAQPPAAAAGGAGQ